MRLGADSNSQSRFLQSFLYEPREILRRPRLHAGGNFFGEQELKQKVGHQTGRT